MALNDFLKRPMRLLNHPANTQRAWRLYRELRQRLAGEAQVVEVFVRVDDPYSVLLLQVLDSIHLRFDIRYRFHPVLDVMPQAASDMATWYAYRMLDAEYLASLYQLHCPWGPNAPPRALVEQATAILLDYQHSEHFIDVALDVFDSVWQNDSTALAALAEGVMPLEYPDKRVQLNENERLLHSLGFDQSGALYYLGEWYPGIDRLDHLERRLIKQHRNHDIRVQAQFTRTYQPVFRLVPRRQYTEGESLPPLTLFLAFDSPYSYLMAEKAVRLAEQYSLHIQIKPLLPRAFLHQESAQEQQEYAWMDCQREALKLNLAPPRAYQWSGMALEYAYSLFDYAEQEQKGWRYTHELLRRVYAEGVDIVDETHLKALVQRAGLDWRIARDVLGGNAWHTWAHRHADSLAESGFWQSAVCLWDDIEVAGHDRLLQVEQAIVRAR